MSRKTSLSVAAANAEANALAALLDHGYLRIYGGTQPKDANTPAGEQNKLAELRFGSPAFSGAVDGKLSANPIVLDKDAAATGKATWFRCFQSDGLTPVLDGSIGTSGCDINMPAVTIQQHMHVSIENLVYTVGA